MALVHALGSTEFEFPPPIRSMITGGAKLSFGLYAIHFPLLSFLGGVLPGYGPAAIALALPS